MLSLSIVHKRRCCPKLKIGYACTSLVISNLLFNGDKSAHEAVRRELLSILAGQQLLLKLQVILGTPIATRHVSKYAL